MIAGDLSIRISAELAQFDKDMATTVSRSGRSGGEAGSRYASEFAKSGETIKNRLQSQLDGVSKNVLNPKDMEATVTRAGSAGSAAGSRFVSEFAKLGADLKNRMKSSLEGMTKQVLNPMAFASAFADGIKTAIKTGNIAQAYVDMVQSLPIVGTFANQLIDIYDTVSGEAALQEERSQLGKQEALRVKRENKKIGEAIKAAEAIAKAEEKKAKEVDDLRRSMADTTAELNSAYAKRAGDEEKAVAFEIDRENERLRQEQAEAEKGATDEQKRQIQEVFRLRRRLNMEEGEQRINEIAKQRREQEKEAKEAAEKAEIEAIEDITFQFEARREELEKLAEKEKELKEKRVKEYTAGIGEGATALGAFKFDAYPATQKKQNDERIVKALEDIRTQQRQTAGGFA